ncbi:MAG: endonuclease V [Candidatus Helarchaeota archaeon]
MIENLNFKKLEQIQKSLSEKIIRKTPINFDLKIATGLDCSYVKDSDNAIAMAVSIDIKNNEVIEKKILRYSVKFPYISGFLGFREVPFFYKLLKKLEYKTDLLLVDGYGILHPRLFGSAAHLGLIMKIPTIGIGKSRFVGVEEYIPDKPGSWAPIIFKKQILGAILKPNTGKYVYVSIGNLIDLKMAIKLVFQLTKKGHRLPEPLYLADKLSKNIIKNIENSN